MAGYVILDVSVTDPALFAQYKEMAPPSVAAYGGRYVVRGGDTQVMEGDWSPQRVVILEFESVSVARQWLESPEYSEARALRQRSAEANVIIVDGA